MAHDNKRLTQLKLAGHPMRPDKPPNALLRAFPQLEIAHRSVAFGQHDGLGALKEFSSDNPLGPPIDLRQVAKLVGCSPWTVRQRLIPIGMPYFRSGASGKLIFYTHQIVMWIQRQQQRGKIHL